MNKLFALLLLVPALFASCSEDDASPLVVYVDLVDFPRRAEAGDLLELEVRAFADASPIRSFSISTYDSERGAVELFDTVPGVSDFSYTYIYEVPFLKSDSVDVTFRFNAVDGDGNAQTASASLLVVGGDRLLQERTGLMLYAANSGKDNAFSLSDPSKLFMSGLVDSLLVDVYAYCDDEEGETLSGEWRSMTGVDFVKNNAFDYVNATSSSVDAVFKGSRKSVNVTGISRGDIIIVGRNSVAEAVFYVVMTYDEQGTANDGYLLNYKMIGH